MTSYRDVEWLRTMVEHSGALFRAAVSTTLGDDWVPTGTVTFVSMITNQSTVPDRGVDRVTTQDQTIAFDTETTTPNVAPSLIPEAQENVPPVMLTRDVLRRMDSCGDYLRRHGQLFPESRWPDGVEVNQENCVTYYRRWDWSWAQGNMLNWEGGEVMNRLAGSRAREVHEKFGTGDPKRAAIFGYLISSCPQYRSERLVEAVAWAATNKDRNAIQAIDRAKRTIQEARQSIEYSERQIVAYRRQIAEVEASLPELERRAAGALKRVAEQNLRDFEARLERHQRDTKTLEERVATQRAEVERIAALELVANEEREQARRDAAAIAEKAKADEADESDAPDAVAVAV